MTEQKDKLAALFAACWKDDALKARFLSNPTAVLAEYDMAIPDGMDVNVVENADNCVHITIPANPNDTARLSDAELLTVSGGEAGGISCAGCPNSRHVVYPNGVLHTNCG
jgi:hypothetical protein